MCEEFGGYWEQPDNLRVTGALHYLQDRLEGSVFGNTTPTSPFEAAAIIVVAIVQGHYFNDGNKRTALQAAWELLVANGIDLELDASAEELAVGVAQGVEDEATVEAWLRRHSKEG
jgi:death-on-curing family protein